MGIPLSEETLRLLDGKNYAVLATINPDGSPQTSVMWVGRDGGDLLFSTVDDRDADARVAAHVAVLHAPGHGREQQVIAVTADPHHGGLRAAVGIHRGQHRVVLAVQERERRFAERDTHTRTVAAGRSVGRSPCGRDELSGAVKRLTARECDGLRRRNSLSKRPGRPVREPRRMPI